MPSDQLQLLPRDFIPYTGQRSIDFFIDNSPETILTLFSEKQHLEREVIESAYRRKVSELFRGVGGRTLSPEDLAISIEGEQQFWNGVKPTGFPVTLKLYDGRDTYHILHQKGQNHFLLMEEAGLLEYMKRIDHTFKKESFIMNDSCKYAKKMRRAIESSEIKSFKESYPHCSVFKNVPKSLSRAVGLEQFVDDKQYEYFLPTTASTSSALVPSYA